MGQQAISRFLDDLAVRMDDLTAADVVHAGTDLRRLLEQYLKQFLALYGILALSNQEQKAVTNEALGALSSLTIRVLNAPDLQCEACRADRRWLELARRLQTASQHANELLGALQRLPRLTNCFPHHVVRGDREMTDGERRQALRLLLHEATTVVGRLRDAGLYPTCLRFAFVQPDPLYFLRFEFESDPAAAGREVVAFTRFPPVIPGASSNLLEAIYRQVLVMMSFTNPERIDPLIAPLVCS
jgi:hypothetical protein